MMLENEDTADRGSHRLIGHDRSNSGDLDDPRSAKPDRKLTAVDGIAIVVGIIIGSGIFSSPGLALERCGSSGVVLIAWTLSGLVTMLAAMCYLELGSIMPSAGGDFDYLRRAYGDRMAFAFAWYNFFVGKTGSQAIIATIFGQYFEAVVRGNTTSLEEGSSSSYSGVSKISAIALVVFITLLNCSGVKESAVLSIVLTATKVLLILMVFMFAIVFVCSGNSEIASGNLSPATSFQGSKSPLGFGSAMVACLWRYVVRTLGLPVSCPLFCPYIDSSLFSLFSLFYLNCSPAHLLNCSPSHLLSYTPPLLLCLCTSFDGFADGNFLLEELINPIRDLPRIIVVGLSIVTACYLLINIGYLSVLDKDTIIDSKAIAIEFGNAVSNSLFNKGKQVLALVLAFGVSMSTAGSENGSIMTGGRAFFAVAREGKAPQSMARLNLAGAPWVALIAQGLWAIVLLCLPGTNTMLLCYYVLILLCCMSYVICRIYLNSMPTTLTSFWAIYHRLKFRLFTRLLRTNLLDVLCLLRIIPYNTQNM
jgi:APA family basic amino acid/polyamine antiporter